MRKNKDSTGEKSQKEPLVISSLINQKMRNNTIFGPFSKKEVLYNIDLMNLIREKLVIVLIKYHSKFRYRRHVIQIYAIYRNTTKRVDLTLVVRSVVSHTFSNSIIIPVFNRIIIAFTRTTRDSLSLQSIFNHWLFFITNILLYLCFPAFYSKTSCESRIYSNRCFLFIFHICHKQFFRQYDNFRDILKFIWYPLFCGNLHYDYCHRSVFYSMVGDWIEL